MMRALNSADILRVWEFAQGKPAVEQALILLAPAFPELNRNQLAALTIGNRDLRLLALREQLAGPKMRGVATCPKCNVELQFNVSVPDLTRGDYRAPVTEHYHECFEDYDISYRLPNSTDQLAVLYIPDMFASIDIMCRRLIQRASFKGEEIEPNLLPENILEAIGDRITDLDPQVEVRFSLGCAVCQHRWSACFEPMRFVWSEINARARSMIDEVVLLARTFGWSERDILAMSPQRRQRYLDMVPTK